MSALELQNKLIQNIQSITDIDLLKALNTIIGKKTDLYLLSQEQQESIKISRSQIKKGQFKSQDVVLNEMKQWLNEK